MAINTAQLRRAAKSAPPRRLPAALSGSRRNPAFFHEVLDLISDGVFISDIVLGRFVDVNNAACALFGYERCELIGCNIATLSTGVPPYTQEAAVTWFEKTKSAPQTFDWHCKKKNGELFWAEISLRGASLGGIDVGLASLRDITVRKAADVALRRSVESAIGLVANTMGVRDPYTGNHQQKVARLAVAIAQEMHLPIPQIEGIQFAGVIHDLGKIGIPAEILSKPGSLSPAEYQLLKEHPMAGYEILKSVDFPWPIAQIVRQHHERVDGSGYPDGLTGDQMLLEAKIIAVADVVEAMVAHRPYRPALGIDMALAEIEAGRARRYDGEVVDACLKLFREDKFDLDAP